MLTTYPTNDPRIIFVCIVVAIVCGWAIGKLLGMGTATRRDPPPEGTFKPIPTPAPPPSPFGNYDPRGAIACSRCRERLRPGADYCHQCGEPIERAPALPPKTGGFVYRWCGPPKANDDLSALRNFVNSEPWVSVPGQWTTTTTTFRPPAR